MGNQPKPVTFQVLMVALIALTTVSYIGIQLLAPILEPEENAIALESLCYVFGGLGAVMWFFYQLSCQQQMGWIKAISWGIFAVTLCLLVIAVFLLASIFSIEAVALLALSGFIGSVGGSIAFDLFEKIETAD